MRTPILRLLGAAWLLGACGDDATVGSGMPVTAGEVTYDRVTSGLSAETVQSALDELAARKPGDTGSLEPRIADLEVARVQLEGRADQHDAALEALHKTVGDHQAALDGLGAKDVAIVDPGIGATTVQEALAALHTALQEEKAARLASDDAHQAAIEALEGTVASQATLLAERKSQLEQLEAQLDVKWKTPRPCPADMVATSDSTCVEDTLRPKSVLIGAMGGCNAAGRRLCSMEELMGPCSTLAVIPTDPIAAVPEWTGDAADVLTVLGTHVLAAVTIGGEVGCQRGKIVASQTASTGVENPEDVNSLQYPFRCCLTR
ncbi:MAG: hypothetical protein AMXMBFR64_33590 [Myxococcales bacterium]